MSTQFNDLYATAHAAGMKAVQEMAPITPMIVGQATDLFSDTIDYSKPTYVVPDGPCGFAWINVKPGNSAFAKWLKATGKARTDSYYGGVTIWVGDFNQSMYKKETYAYAFAKVLSDAGIKAYASSRMD